MWTGTQRCGYLVEFSFGGVQGSSPNLYEGEVSQALGIVSFPPFKCTISALFDVYCGTFRGIVYKCTLSKMESLAKL